MLCDTKGCKSICVVNKLAVNVVLRVFCMGKALSLCKIKTHITFSTYANYVAVARQQPVAVKTASFQQCLQVDETE